MRVVFASAEVSPVATVGGLAFAVAGLAAELRRMGVDVELVMPDYGDTGLIDETSSTISSFRCVRLLIRDSEYQWSGW